MENPNVTPEQVVEKLNTMFKEAVEKSASKEDFDALKSEFETLKTVETKSTEIEKAIAKLDGKLEALTESAKFEKKAEKVGSVGEQVTKGYADQVDAIKAGKTLNLDVKTTIDADYTGTRALTELDPVVDNIVRQRVLLQNVVNRGVISTKFVTYIQQTLQSSASWIAEAGAKTIGNVQYEEVSEEVKKVAGIIKVSKEMLSDLSFMRSEINGDLMRTVEAQIEDQLLNGDGLGANLKGILSQAPTFTAGGFATSVIDANISDVLRCAIAQIEEAHFMPNFIVLHPRDVAKLHLTKTTTGEYTYGAFIVNPLTGEPQLLSLRVLSTTYMNEGDFLVGDMSMDNLRFREAMNISVGYVNDDFQKNMVSILAEARLVNYIKANQTGAFVKGNIATAIASINQ